MKSEFETNFYPFYKVFSINNNINPTVDILIESIDRFSFGEDADQDKLLQKNNEEEITKKTAPNNYGFMRTENNLNESNSKLQDLNNIINNISEIKIMNDLDNKNRGKICGIFNKEDFEVKNEKKNYHKNNQLNDSFEKKYSNPLKNLLDDEDDIPVNNNNKNTNNIINDLPIKINEQKANDINKLNDDAIKEEKINKENELNKDKEKKDNKININSSN